MLYEVFIDTGFWFAYLVRRDSHHQSSVHLLSFTDAASASLVMRHGIPAIATYDRHFSLMGLPCLP